MFNAVSGRQGVGGYSKRVHAPVRLHVGSRAGVGWEDLAAALAHLGCTLGRGLAMRQRRGLPGRHQLVVIPSKAPVGAWGDTGKPILRFKPNRSVQFMLTVRVLQVNAGLPNHNINPRCSNHN